MHVFFLFLKWTEVPSVRLYLSSGAVGESVARGEDALCVVENPDTQKVVISELSEVIIIFHEV